MKNSEIKYHCPEEDLEECICPLCNKFPECDSCSSCSEGDGKGSPVDSCGGYPREEEEGDEQ